MLSTFCLCANAYDTYYIPQNESPIFKFNVYSPAETVKANGEYIKPFFTIPQAYLEPVFLSAQNWNEKINLTSSPIKSAVYSYLTENDYGASAGSPCPVDPPARIPRNRPRQRGSHSSHSWNFPPRRATARTS